MTVAKGRLIKGEIRKRFEEQFTAERAHVEEQYAKEILATTMITPVASRRNAVSLNLGSSLVDGHIATSAFTDEDSSVPNKPRVGVFPVSDDKLFPPRSKAVGWELGLRSYFPPDVRDVRKPAVDDVEQLAQPTSIATLSIKPQRGVLESPRSVSPLSIKSVPTADKFKHKVADLLEPTDEQKSRYFGPHAKKQFHNTYQQLCTQADMLLGGFDTLHEVVKSKDHNNVLVGAMLVLQNEGVLSPRPVTKPNTVSKTPKSALRSGGQVGAGLPPLQIRSSAESSLTATTSAAVQWSLDDHDNAPTKDIKLNSILDDYSYKDNAGDLNYSLGSPRAIFLSGCLKHSLPPKAQVLLRKRTSSTINLAHMGIGNKMAIVLAESLHDLPFLQVLNLCDNNLEDSGLSALLLSIKKHPTIEILDISQNIIDSQAADALADLVGNADCRLQCLRMSDANIDDSECARFVQVLMHNRHLKELDMSKNLLGKDENLNAVQPDFETGGESLAELIRIGSCPLQTLNLHWNMIRLEGAEVLCDSLRNNQHLINLDLSYNALGRSAASVLGAALFENGTLQVINLANNGIDAIGSFTLFVGLRQNKSVSSLIVDGNPIGEQGARMLMKVAANDGQRLEISAKNCDFAVKNGDVKFNIDDPFGEHVLDLSQPYDRAILIELLDIVSVDSTVEVASFEYVDGAMSRPATPGRDAKAAAAAMNAHFSNAQPYRVLKFEDTCSSLYAAQETELQQLRSFGFLTSMHVQDLRALIMVHNRSGCITTGGLRHMLLDMRVKHVEEVVRQIFFTLDPLKMGFLEVDEFIEYISMRIKVISQREWQLQHRPKCFLQLLQRIATGQQSKLVPVDSSAAPTCYIPPQTGWVRVKVIESYDCPQEDQVQSYPLSSSKCVQIMKIANMSTNPVMLLTYAIDSSKLYLEEAQKLYDEIIQKSDDPTPLLAKVLMRMLLSEDAMRMIKCYTNNDVLKIRRLKQRLGLAYYPLIGIYSGYYCLDLSGSLDRLCLKKLIEKSIRNVASRRRRGLWDTSQHGSFSCFRNEFSEKGDLKVSPAHFYPIPQKGKIEFDFINIDRPNSTFCRAAPDERVIDCLLLSRLLPEDHHDWVNRRLTDLGMSVRRSFLSNGAPVWKMDIGLAIAAADNLQTIYTSLSQRRQTRKKAAKRELIKTAVLVEKKVDKKKDQKGNRTSYFSSSASMKKSASARGLATATVPEVAPSNNSSTPVAAVSEEGDEQLVEEGKVSGASYLPKVQIKMKDAAVKFKALLKVSSRSERAQKLWGQRLFDVMESTGSDEYKSAAVLEFFESELVHHWLYCKQVALVVEVFCPLGLALRSNVGNYRVELIVMVFDRIVDLDNFELVLSELNVEEIAALRARIGILNFFNPNKPEGGQSLDLARWEERQLTKMLVHLSVAEPGENWLNKSFIFDRGFAPIPGWDLSVTWLSEDGLPKKGLLSFEFFAGDGLQLLGCKVDVRTRKLLAPLVLVEQRNYLNSILNKDMLIDELCATRKVRALDKLSTQSSLFANFNDYDACNNVVDAQQTADSASASIEKVSMRLHTLDDANHSLACTDITWTYNDNADKFEPWFGLE